MGVVVLRGGCSTNKGSSPIEVIIMRGRYPKGVVVVVGNWQRSSCPIQAIVLHGSCPLG